MHYVKSGGGVKLLDLDQRFTRRGSCSALMLVIIQGRRTGYDETDDNEDQHDLNTWTFVSSEGGVM
jgi:hypothetical protein